MKINTKFDFLEYYRQLGADIKSMACGCAVKVDLYSVVYPALKSIKKQIKGITISERKDADVFIGPDEDIEIFRRLYDLENLHINPEDLEKIRPSRATLLVQVYQGNARSAKLFEKIIGKFFKKLSEALPRPGLYIGKGHSIITTKSDKNFAIVDFIKEYEEDEVFYAVNNDTIQIVDPSSEWGSDVQVFPALSNALNDIFSLGFHEELKLYSIIDFPKEDVLKQALSKADEFCKRYNIKHISKPVDVRTPLLGATVIAKSNKTPPMFYDKVGKDMKILVHRPIGDLAVINTYLACYLMDYLREILANRAGLSLKELEKLKNRVVETLKTPNFTVARIINKFIPERHEKFRADEHIAVTTDLSGPGIFALKELAETCKIDIMLSRIDFHSERVARFAAENFLIPDSTSGTNGAIAIIASEQVVEEIEGELRKADYKPFTAGCVLGAGKGDLFVKRNIADYISNPQLRNKLRIIN